MTRGAASTLGTREALVIDHYVQHPLYRARLRIGPLGEYLDRFAGWLVQRGYAKDTGGTYLRYAGYLSWWMADAGVAVSALDEAAITRFIAVFPTLPSASRKKKGLFVELPTAMRILLTRLRADGLIRPAPAAAAIPPIIADFETWMLQYRGVLERTLRKGYRVVLLRLLAVIGEDPATYTAAGVRSYVVAQVERLGRARVVTRLQAVRMFLRYLIVLGRCSPGLAAAVPRLAPWRLTALPKTISVEDVERLLSTCDTTTRTGRRDRAVLLMLARLGVRAVDVANLDIDDIDWSAARLWVSSKSRRREALPLPQDVGDALLDYLANGRPDADGRRVFATVVAPYKSLDPGTVAAVVIRAARRAGVALPRKGSHVLRHSLATRLLSEGMSLAGIGAVLRHATLDTTRIYAKVDVGSLSTVARPWPVGVS